MEEEKKKLMQEKAQEKLMKIVALMNQVTKEIDEYNEFANKKALHSFVESAYYSRGKCHIGTGEGLVSIMLFQDQKHEIIPQPENFEVKSINFQAKYADFDKVRVFTVE